MAEVGAAFEQQILHVPERQREAPASMTQQRRSTTRRVTSVGTARNRLLKTPAPNAEAMLFKLDLLASIMAESHSENASALAMIGGDTRRLLAAREDISEAESV